MTRNNPTSVLATDDSAVRNVLDGVYAAWANNNADAFVELYTEDATSALPGSYSNNRDEIRTRMAAGFAGPLKGSRVIDEVQNVRFIGDDAAVVISKSGILMSGETEVPAERWVLASWVLSKQNGKWLIEAYHNCPAKTA